MTLPLDEKLAQVGTADLVDAMGRLHHHRCHILDLVSPTPGRVLFGPALTISYFPACNTRLEAGRYNFARIFYEATGDDAEGKVLVLASNGHPDASLGGGTKLSRVRNLGLAGVLTDGRLRDFDQLAGYDFTTYCRGEAVRWGGDVVTPFQANVPVVVEGVGIFPADYIYADSAGAVIIPGAQVVEVVEEAVRVSEEDRGFLESIKREDPGAPPWDDR
ncbi:MAG: RraA family protein [Acidimicrobiia bacterium]